MEKEIICLGCPNGCHLCVRGSHRGDIEVLGQQCDRGIDYGRDEFLEPKRVVTAVVRTGSDDVPFIPVKTDKPVPIPMIPKLLDLLYGIEVELPVKAGDSLLSDYEGSGIAVVCTRSVA